MRRSERGITLVEILVATTIVVILAGIVFSISPGLINKFGKARCIANLKSIHLALASYVQEKEMWPQSPDAAATDSKTYEDWWMTTLDPYTDSRKMWICPTMAKSDLAVPEANRMKMHYMPTKFDANPVSPYRWAGQPWAVEIGNAHGDGGLIIFPDGSVRSLGEVLRNR